MKKYSLFSVVIALVVNFLTAQDIPKIDKELVNKATTDAKAATHVVVTEVVESKHQQDWTSIYNATIEVFQAGVSKGKFRGSSLPNDKPRKDWPEYEYSVVISTGSLKSSSDERYYTWVKGLRAEKDANGKDRPCLRLNQKVPTINVGTARDRDKFIASIIHGAIKGDYHYAENILVHAGDKANWRGSAGCLTIHPDDAAAFFKLIPENARGTLALYRGLHDAETHKSYNY
jgi:hypothetical protein